MYEVNKEESKIIKNLNSNEAIIFVTWKEDIF